MEDGSANFMSLAEIFENYSVTNDESNKIVFIASFSYQTCYSLFE